MLVLASASPRRRELLALLGVPFEVMPSGYQEPPPPASPTSLPDLVKQLARCKALDVANRIHDDARIIVGADTLVTLSHAESGLPLGKPADHQDAVRMLTLLSGETHYVYTGVALVRRSGDDASVIACRSARTAVTFRAISIEMIADYVATGEPMDKAGAYGAQGYAAPFITSISGDYFNVVGLPLSMLCAMLEDAGIEWWRYRIRLPEIIG